MEVPKAPAFMKAREKPINPGGSSCLTPGIVGFHKEREKLFFFSKGGKIVLSQRPLMRARKIIPF